MSNNKALSVQVFCLFGAQSKKKNDLQIFDVILYIFF